MVRLCVYISHKKYIMCVCIVIVLCMSYVHITPTSAMNLKIFKSQDNTLTNKNSSQDLKIKRSKRSSSKHHFFRDSGFAGWFSTSPSGFFTGDNSPVCYDV